MFRTNFNCGIKPIVSFLVTVVYNHRMATAELTHLQSLEECKLPFPLPQTSQMINSQGGDARDLFLMFFQTPQAKNILQITADFILSHQAEELKDYKQHLAGRVFDELTAIHLQTIFGPKYTILTARDFVELYGCIDNRTQVISHNGILDEITGVSIPDILKLRNAEKTWQIEKVYECKLKAMIDFDYIHSRYYHWPHGLSRLLHFDNSHPGTSSKKLGEQLNMAFPNLENKPVMIHPKAKFEFAIPNNAKVRGDHLHIIIPLHTLTFGQTLQAIMEDCAI